MEINSSVNYWRIDLAVEPPRVAGNVESAVSVAMEGSR